MGPASLAHHKEVITEMIQRDKNRPSVIMWSVANEPSSNLPEAEDYFRYEFIPHLHLLLFSFLLSTERFVLCSLI